MHGRAPGSPVGGAPGAADRVVGKQQDAAFIAEKLRRPQECSHSEQSPRIQLIASPMLRSTIAAEQAKGVFKPRHRCSRCGARGFPTMIDQPADYPVLRLSSKGTPRLLCSLCRDGGGA